ELTAVYAGSSNFAASDESEPVEVAVAAATTTTTVTGPATVVHGHALTLQVAVAGGAALPDDGSEVELVEVLDGGATRSLGTVSLVAGEGLLPLHVSGEAVAPLAPGAHHLEARFAGDSRFAASIGTI